MFVLVIPPFLTLSSWKNCVPSFHRLRWTFRPRRNVSICGWRWCDSTLTAKPSSPDLFPASAVSRRVWYAFAFIKQHLEYCLWPNLLSRRLKVPALHQSSPLHASKYCKCEFDWMRRFFLSLHLYYKTTFYKKKSPSGTSPRSLGALVAVLPLSNLISAY